MLEGRVLHPRVGWEQGGCTLGCAGREGARPGKDVGLGGDTQWGWALQDVVGSGEGGSWTRGGSHGCWPWKGAGGVVVVLIPVCALCPHRCAAHLMVVLVSRV